jgi:hypothetical protein
MSRLAAFLAGFTLAAVSPVAAAKVELLCRPVLKPEVNCVPNYNPKPPECHIA